MKIKRILGFLIIVMIFIIFYQSLRWDSEEIKLFYSPQPVYAWEKLDFFIVDSNQNYYVEDNEKNIIQKFDKYGNFVLGYSFGIPIVGIRIEGDIVHVLTKNKKEYALEQKKIIYLNISDENDEKWYSYMDTDEYDKYYIFHRKISKVLDNENEEVIELKAPVLPIPTRWYCYCISFCLFTMFMKWLFSLKKKEKEICIKSDDIECIWRGYPELKMCISLRRAVNIIWSLPGLFITILGIMSLIQGDLAWTAAFLSVGIPFVWLGIGDLFLIQYIKRHSEYLITENEVIIMKHYKEDFIYKIPIKDIQQIDIFGRCKETASIKFVVKDCVYSALAHKYEEDIFYDLLEAEKVVSFIREQTRSNIKIKYTV